MKLINTGKSRHSLSFSMPYELTDNAGVKQIAFKLVVVDPKTSVRVDPESWKKIADRKSIKALIYNKELLVSEADESGLLDEPEPIDEESRQEMKKKREKQIKELRGINWKRAINELRGMHDVQFLKDWRKGETRASVKKELDERLEELQNSED
jgi:hypothetical protein